MNEEFAIAQNGAPRRRPIFTRMIVVVVGAVRFLVEDAAIAEKGDDENDLIYDLEREKKT